MIKVYRLVKRHIDDAKSDSSELNQIKIFSTCIGHGVGKIDFSEEVLEIEDSEYEKILESGDEYLKFKIGNLSKYSEIEIFPEHATKLLPKMIECPLKEILKDLKEGYLVLQKDFT
ncbi:formate hydrogenlyase maturation HycH family protein [Sulfurospirillum arcachonense]|uniref:formate hydrogenlyase maturation HycH family protein n=1 Tax=Sulfurospirillum arcachonense TaxID=57666 RepID=UPI000469353B|nr:formate hydrogenlyase maturation HycH family protein [Sulfurospirillum arcachonense]